VAAVGVTWIQVLGVLLAAVGLALVWSPWALVVAGGALWALPEVAALVAARRAVAKRPKTGSQQ
jgi:hypothetical protein